MLIELVRFSKDKLRIDLNEEPHIFNVQMRRIYGITDVLEGIKQIEKIEKNKINWKKAIFNTCNFLTLIYLV
jgi:E2F/DP family winged-helix DNA-binding domain